MPQAPARPDAAESSDAARLITAHHRRRGWAWVAVGSAIGLAVYAGIDISLFENLTGAAEVLSVAPVVALIALVLAGLVIVLADTSRIHRADAAVRVSAKRRVSHHPFYAHAHRYPHHHHGSWVFAVVMLGVMAVIALGILPAEVDSWAYVVGAESSGTFNPVSYSNSCTGMPRGGCHIVTNGYLSTSGARVTMGSQLPLGQPVSVREPLLAWGSGRSLTSGDPAAIGTIIAGLFFDGMTALLVYVLIVITRDSSSGQSKRTPRRASGVRRRGGR